MLDHVTNAQTCITVFAGVARVTDTVECAYEVPARAVYAWIHTWVTLIYICNI